MKLVNAGEWTGDIINTVLENRGIEDKGLFLKPTNDFDSDPSDLINIEEGYKLFRDHLHSFSKIVIIVDADMDGFTSASVMYQYIKDFDDSIDVRFMLHPKKAHGLTEHIMKKLSDSDAELVIVPDAGSNDVEQIEELVKSGKDVLVIDHHEVDKHSEYGIIVNNQLSPLVNKSLVGAGVVYKFLQYADERLHVGTLDNYLDLVAAGQIGDSSDISDPEIRYLVTEGLKKIKNPFFKTVLGEVELGYRHAAKHLSFNLIPFVNAVVRVGTEEENRILFEALSNIESHRTFVQKKRRKNKTTGKFEMLDLEYNLYEYAFDLATSAKNKQNNLVKRIMKNLSDSVDTSSGVAVAFIPSHIDPQGVTGLIANKYMRQHNKPTLVVQNIKGNWVGSGRGHEKTFEDFRAWCQETNLVNFAQGHGNAFGISIPERNISDFMDCAGKIEKQEAIYECDLITDQPDPDMATLIDKNLWLFGGKVTDPVIGIEQISVPKKFIDIKGSMLKIWSYGVSMVMFSADDELLIELTEYPKDNIIFNIVGTYSINRWGDRKQPQLVIDDIEIVEVPQIEETPDEEELIF